MPLIFPPRSNLFARASIAVALVLLTIIVGILVWWTHSPTFTQVGVTVQQPVPFNHSFHVSAVGLNCRFCHTGVDRTSFADIPPTQTCMGCHSQIKTDSPLLAPVRQSWETGEPIQWNRVNNLPDFVFFNHSIHITKGVGCETCHGRVDQMGTVVKAKAFYMSWCTECHRDPAQYVRPLDKVYEMGYQPAGDQKTLGAQLVEENNIEVGNRLLNCSTCHR